MWAGAEYDTECVPGGVHMFDLAVELHALALDDRNDLDGVANVDPGRVAGEFHAAFGDVLHDALQHSAAGTMDESRDADTGFSSGLTLVAHGGLRSPPRGLAHSAFARTLIYRSGWSAG